MLDETPQADSGTKAHVSTGRIADLGRFLAPRDLVVVNDAATLPASLQGRDANGAAIEVRLVARRGPRSFAAVLFGAGDWRTRTEDRPAPPTLAVGAHLSFGANDALAAIILLVSPLSRRLVTLKFDRGDDALFGALYTLGRPIQYSHHDEPLPLWAVQNVYAARPAAFELPSAGRPLTWSLLSALRARGVALASLTHAAGLSAVGDPILDALLPLPESYEIPRATARAVRATRARGGRVIAVGTTVVRALESAAAHTGEVRAGAAETNLRIGPGHRRRVVDGLLCGMHAPGESHYELLQAFAAPAHLARATEIAARAGFYAHELGDSTLILAPRPR